MQAHLRLVPQIICFRALCVSVLLLWAALGHAVVRNVNSGVYYPTITQAVTAAANHDVLNIATGVYNEAVTINGKWLTLDGGYQTNCITQIASAMSVITKPPFSGTALTLANATAVVLHVAVTGVTSCAINVRDYSVLTGRYVSSMYNRAGTLGNGGGLCVRYGAQAVLEDANISYNTAPSAGGGVFVSDSSLLECGAATHVQYNYANEGGGVAVTNAGVLIHAMADVAGNTAARRGGGLLLVKAHATVRGSGTSIGYLMRNMVTNGSGGGIFARSSTVVLSNETRLSRNYASGDGGGIALQNSTLLADHMRIGALFNTDTNYAGGNGGGIYADRSSVTLTNGMELFNGSAANGAGIYALTSLVVIAGSTVGRTAGVFSNRARIDGGAFYGIGSTALLSGASILENSADDDGGGFYFEKPSYFTATNCSFSGNVAGSGSGHRGGAFCALDGPTYACFDNCQIISNSAGQEGGAVYWYLAGNLYLRQGTRLVYNTAKGDGGALFAGNGTVTITGDWVYLSHNTAGGNGGGILLTDMAQLRAQFASFNGNSAYNGGGLGVYGLQNRVVLTANFFVDNLARATNALTDLGGGAVAVAFGGAVDIVNSYFTDNVSSNHGGAIACYAATLSITGDYAQARLGSGIANEIRYNEARQPGRQGGGILLAHGSRAAISHTCFVGNHVGGYGGALYVYDDTTCTVVNCLLSGNKADIHGDAARTSDAHLRMLYCTIVYNNATGVSGIGNAILSLTNCIVWGQTSENVENDYDVQYSDVQGGYATGTGNLNADPLFVNTNILDYSLQAGSPCIEAGTLIPGITTDCMGNPRVQGSETDMGCYESVPEPAAGVALMLLAISHARYAINRRRRALRDTTTGGGA